MNAIYRDSDGLMLRFGFGDLDAQTGETERSDAPTPSFRLGKPDDSGDIHKWNGSAWELIAQPTPSVGRGAQFSCGTYVGDGSTSQAINNLGFAPDYVKIWVDHTVSGQSTEVFETTKELVDNIGEGMSITHREGSTPPHASLSNCIKSIDADGFTVGDQGNDSHPNKNTQIYHYLAIG